MSPIKSSLAKTVGKLLGVQKDTDLSLRGDLQSSRRPPDPPPPPVILFAMFGGGGSGAGWVGGGGGGGGYVEESIPIETGVTYTVSIGAAGNTPGPGPPAGNGLGNDGGNTTFVTPGGTFTAYGGGGGGGNGQADSSVGPGRPGGSGGGMGAGSYSPATVGLGNKVTGSTNPAQASPPQPQTLSRVQGYDGGAKSGDSGGGGGGAGSVGADSPGSGGDGGSAVTLSNFGPFNGTYGGGGGGCPASSGAGGTGGGNAGDGVSTNQTAKNATGYANGGGGVREAGHPGGAATAGIFVLRVPTSYNITSPGGSTSNDSDYKYLQRTSPGNVSISDA